MQENQIKVGDLVIPEDTLFVLKEEQLPGIVLSVWTDDDPRERQPALCIVQHPAFRSRWQTRFLKVLARA